MAHKILMPRLTDTMHEGQITFWYKKEGDTVSKGEDLFGVETDKAVVDVEAGETGFLLKIVTNEGEFARVGDIVAVIGEKGEDVASLINKPETKSLKSTKTAIEQPQSGKSRVKASPVAKRKAKELNVNLTLVTGTGPDGLITKKNLDDYLKESSVVSPPGRSEDDIEQRIPLKGVLKVMAEKMTRSANIPQATTFAEVDVSDLVSLSKEHSIKITPIIICAVVEALKEARIINSSLEGDEIVVWRHLNIGVSISTPRGLIVPVIHHAETLGVHQIAEELKGLSQKARENRLSLDEVSQASFTVTNSGVFGSLFFTPRVNPPESAIMGVGKTMKQPVVRDDQIVIRSIMMISLSYDHRIIAGESAVGFLQDVKRLLETPDELL